MDLKTYLDTHDGKALAAKVGANPVYLRHIALGYRNAGEKLSIAIERETGGLVTVAELRPDLAAELASAGYRRGRAETESDAEAPVEAVVDHNFPEPVHDDRRADERRHGDRRQRGEQRQADRRHTDRRDGV